MSINFEAALKAPFGKKMGFGTYALMTILLFIPIVNLFFIFVFGGALIKYMRCVVKGEEAEFSIFDDKKSSFGIGLKALLGAFVLELPYIVLVFILSMLLNFESREFLLAIVTMPISLIISLILPLMFMNFALDLKISSMFDFQRAAFLFKGDPKGYIMTLIFALPVCLIYGIAFAIPLIGLIAMIFLFVPMSLTKWNIFGQYLKENKAVEVIKQKYQLD